MIYATPRVRDAQRVTLPAPMKPLPPEVRLWLDGDLSEPDPGPTPEEWDAAESLDFTALDPFDPASLARRYSELDALAAWQALHHDHGMSGAEAAAIVCGEG